ncbi:MAG: tRNA (N(6)-L-threonylcarbamoyladenosine(37)-C(2))-methylthiotransferase MtaB [Armatimonadota bacterium]|nr:MAG: tRNA (N(6)-L-threonylcarbamoyladenosine(37)-C(2))-methylthiotransferase MtaB [Armatimonadota bacterium]
MSPPAVSITTLGCKVNQCDADEIAQALAARGCEIVSPGAPADIHLVNTCTVTATADAKARKLIRKLARAHPHARILVTGCWAQRNPEAIAALPEVHAVVPNTRKAEIPDMIATSGPAPAATSSPAPRPRTRAFLKIQDGCDHRCAYCAVPDARGRPVSKPMAHVVEEAQKAADRGAQELVLCGIRLGVYGNDRGEAGLAALLHDMRALGIPRLRLSSLEPMDICDDLLAEIADHPTLCHHLHLPLQSGDDAVLAAMNRGYTQSDFAQLVRRVRAAWPNAAITTDVMVGFPGETDEQFQRTADFVRDVAFSRLHVFPFSVRPDTPAAKLPNRVAAHTRRDRTQHMLSLAHDLARAAAQTWLGRKVSVLFEQRESDGRLTGLTEHYVRLRCPATPDLIGHIAEVVPAEEVEGSLAAGL